MRSLFLVLVLAWSLWAAGLCASLDAWNGDAELWCAGIGVVLTLAWILIVAMPARRPASGDDPPRSGVGFALVWPVAVAIVVAGWSTSTPLAIRVLLSEDSLREVVAASEDGSISRSAGLFEVEGTDRLDGCTFLIAGEALEGGPAGLVFVPDGAVRPTRFPTGQGARFRHVTGNWWRFETFT